MSLIDDEGAPPARGGNAPEFSVSELSGALKRMVEGEFPFVRVRGEVGRVTRASSGHLYFDLKDERAVLSAVTWKGQVAALTSKPEEGMEVVATGRLTTFPGQSRYQMVVEDVAPAGAGALMAQLEARRAKLASEGLFDAARKRPIPYLPDVIGVVTSPQGAVIRDVLHRLRDRFPRTVVVWPVAVQGAACAPEVARAVAGFNALAPGGAIPRPDVIIVARGGGSIEDLWGFNDERVVRAVAASAIPVISAVGHETDTTLIDHAADLRAPTPTAAAEFAVPVRADLLDRTGGLGLRAARALRQGVRLRRQRLGDLARALPRADAVTGEARQRLDFLGSHLLSGLRGVAGRGRVRLADLSLRPGLLRRAVVAERRRLREAGEALGPALEARARRGREEVGDLGRRLHPAVRRGIAACARGLGLRGPRLGPLAARAVGEARGGLGRAGARLSPDLALSVVARLEGAMLALDRQRAALGYVETLRRGFAVVRAGGEGGPVVTTAAEAGRERLLDVEFADGHVAVAVGSADGPGGGTAARPAGPRRRAGPAEAQGRLLSAPR